MMRSNAHVVSQRGMGPMWNVLFDEMADSLCRSMRPSGFSMSTFIVGMNGRDH